jgi:hypothetical protein
MANGSTPLYRMLMSEIERRRLELGWPMWKVDDSAGTQDGYDAKCLHPQTPNGRRARWETLQLIVNALFTADARVTLEPVQEDMPGIAAHPG